VISTNREEQQRIHFVLKLTPTTNKPRDLILDNYMDAFTLYWNTGQRLTNHVTWYWTITRLLS